MRHHPYYSILQRLPASLSESDDYRLSNWSGCCLCFDVGNGSRPTPNEHRRHVFEDRYHTGGSRGLWGCIMPVERSRTVLQILESARLAVLEDRDEMQAAVPDEELANHLIASRYVFEAAEHMAKQKLIRLGTIDCAIEKARYDALDASLKESLNTNKGS